MLLFHGFSHSLCCCFMAFHTVYVVVHGFSHRIYVIVPWLFTQSQCYCFMAFHTESMLLFHSFSHRVYVVVSWLFTEKGIVRITKVVSPQPVSVYTGAVFHGRGVVRGIRVPVGVVGVLAAMPPIGIIPQVQPNLTVSCKMCVSKIYR